ncbi:ACT domain-containing protein [Neisseria sp. P0004.S004]|uniref:ACT domain-containing protein n=1 Tax=unclassified Neisseria TaxID=2623750 RepID=UPI00066A5BBB
MNNSVITVIGKDRVGIVYDVSKILAENQINILNISQQLMDDFFTMIILVDTSKCAKSRQEVLDLFAEESKKFALDIRMQNEEIFQAMHRI